MVPGGGDVAFDLSEGRRAGTVVGERRRRREWRLVQARREPHLARDVRRYVGVPLDRAERGGDALAEPLVAHPLALQPARTDEQVDRQADYGQKGEDDDPGQGRGGSAAIRGHPDRHPRDPEELDEPDDPPFHRLSSLDQSGARGGHAGSPTAA